ncbi:MAG: exoenzyme regulation regulon ORF2-like protein [Rhodospirillales bacterium]|jgi:MioC protein|nr:exoenzyme regulation regulon ORF2-like protein [Rhodospirillales bacterium]
MPSLRIYVGTMTGTAEMVAQEIEDRLGGEGIACETQSMDGLDATAFTAGETYLICTSTYGQGDVPDNAQQFFTSLETERPDLTGVGFGLFGLGDRTYRETFCFGPKRFQTLLTELGARLIGEPVYHDASAGTMAEEVAGEWVIGWLDSWRAEQVPPRCAAALPR